MLGHVVPELNGKRDRIDFSSCCVLDLSTDTHVDGVLWLKTFSSSKEGSNSCAGTTLSDSPHYLILETNNPILSAKVTNMYYY